MDIVTWALGLLAAGALALLGAFLGRRGEHARWVREKRYDAAVKYIELTNSYAQGDLELKPGKPVEEQLKDQEVVAVAANSIDSALQLPGPKELRMRSLELRMDLFSLLHEVEPSKRYQRFVISRAEFIDTARRELGFKQHWWQFWRVR